MVKVAVRPSPISGLGVFALEPATAGQVIRAFEFEREVTADAPLRPELGERPEHCPELNGRYYLVAEPDRYFNHCCRPNIYLQFREEAVDVVAINDIVPDTELTLDYLINNAGGDSWPCHCGVSRCRRQTCTSFFDLPETIQREYYPFLATWFRERFAGQLAHLDKAPRA